MHCLKQTAPASAAAGAAGFDWIISVISGAFIDSELCWCGRGFDGDHHLLLSLPFYLPPFFFRLILVMEISPPTPHPICFSPYLPPCFLFFRRLSPDEPLCLSSFSPAKISQSALVSVLLSDSLINTVERPVGGGWKQRRGGEEKSPLNTISTFIFLPFLILIYVQKPFQCGVIKMWNWLSTERVLSLMEAKIT